MKTLGLTIKLVIEVEDNVVSKFQRNTGFIFLGDEPLGSEDLTVSVRGEHRVKPVDIRIKTEELTDVKQADFLA